MEDEAPARRRPSLFRVGLGSAVAAGVMLTPLALSSSRENSARSEAVERGSSRVAGSGLRHAGQPIVVTSARNGLQPVGVTPAAPLPPAAAAALTLVGRTIVIDPGHGGPDEGASTEHPPLLEKSVNLDIALRLRSLLEERGARVVMTRDTDRKVATIPGHVEELQARADISNDTHPTLFLSIHNNASDKASMHGTEVYISRHASAQSRALADSIFDRLDDELPTDGNGVKTAGYYVLRHTDAPAVLTEIAYLTNVGDATHLNDPKFRQEAAEALADGIGDYVHNEVMVAGTPTTVPQGHLNS